MLKIHQIREHLLRHWRLWLLVVVSYLPLLVLQTGKINADTKLYLGEDPGGLISRSLFAWDSSQFGGFVPHQAIAYLWPSGPFFWFFDLVGSPQWLTQRLWVGTIFLTASLGVYVLLRQLAFSANASFIGAFFFMSSPYVLAYQSRTSSMLLPWAAIAWLTYFTMRGMRSRSWLWPSLIALTMCTVGSVNATATLLILPAPILMVMVHFTRQDSFATLAIFTVKTFFLTAGVSLWWIVMLYIQATYGAQLLSYSETLESVASTSHAFEVLRGFGYWLNYVGLDSLPLTTGALRVFTSITAMTTGVLLVLLAVGSLALSQHPQRRLGLWLLLVGTVLSVGVYPINNAAPLFSSFANNPTSTLSLALRSSTRAIPVLLLGLALGVAILCDSASLPRPVTHLLSRLRLPTRTHQMASLFIVVAIIGLANPSRYTSGAVEPTLSRTPIPTSWRNFADIIDASSIPHSRVVQLPGQEFGAYTWGYTVDPALPAVSDTPLLTRDLIPLGNESMMNVLWATDEAFREGRLHPNALASLARVLSTRTYFFPGDLDNQRYSTPRQDTALTSNALNEIAQVLDSGTQAHRYITFDSTTGAIIRQQLNSVLLLGDGKGIVDAAIAGVLGNDTVIYAGHLSQQELSALSYSFSHVIVTDTNTEKAQHWRTSIDTLGFDENRDGDLVNFARDSGDIRMRIFSPQRNDDITWFEHIGPVRVRASSYGPPLTYRPEHRPFAAIDNNPTTSWSVAHGVTPLAPVIQLISQEPISTLKLLQPQGDINRRISQISVSIDEQPWVPYSLSETSLTQGDILTLDSAGYVITIRIDTTVPTRPLRTNEELSGVGFAEIGTGASPTQEVGVLPTRGLDTLAVNTPMSYILTRRVAPRERTRRFDIEHNFARSIYVPHTQQMTVTARFDVSDFSEQQVSQLIQSGSTQSLVRINGQDVSFAPLTPTTDGHFITKSAPLTFSPGNHLIETTTALQPVDYIVITNTTPAQSSAPLLPNVISSQLTRKTLEIQPCPDGCWLIFGEGHSNGWKATLNNQDLGKSLNVDGGSNGWWIEPTTRTEMVTIEFTPQRSLNFALIISALSILMALVALITSRRTRHAVHEFSITTTDLGSAWNLATVTALHAIMMWAFIDVRTAVWTSLLVALSIWLRRQKLLTWLATATFTYAMTASWWESHTTHIPLNFGWTTSTQASHHTLVVCLILLASLSLATTNPAPPKLRPIH